MDSNCMTSSTFLHTRSHLNPKTNQSWARVHHQNSTSNFRMYEASTAANVIVYSKWFCREGKEGSYTVELGCKAHKGSQYEERNYCGAVALIVGTSIGSGILALPEKASPAGLIPSSISIVICWGFLLIEALLLIEINVSMRRRKERKTKGMNWSSKSGEILFHLINLPPPVSGFFFTSIFTLLICIGGTQATDQVNQLLTTSMIGLLVAIEVLAVTFGGWSGLEGSGDWGKVPATIPVIIFSLVYHDLAPVLCAYLGSDLKRLRISVFLGSLVPFLGLIVWDAIALGLSAQADQVVDPVELLMRVKWSGVSYMVDGFSLLAVGTSLIGTLLGLSEKNNLIPLSWNSPSHKHYRRNQSCLPYELRKWWAGNKISFASVAMAVIPSLFVSTTIPDAFSTATDIAGGYCMTMLYGLLPPAMAWTMHNKERDDASNQKTLSRARPVLLAVGLLACAIVGEQILQDILTFHF
ncbi:hypothetical protein M0R45_037069 [Rubus argutus]|uniref:Tyrosine-specific transport protein n=1 Tax=Rubus argutus TaxID=59490 RepID=A0AAW1VZN5_RUBAR